MDIDWAGLREKLGGLFTLDIHSIHGATHWRHVEHYGLEVARYSGGDLLVVRLFAAFHDICRVRDGRDHAHGARGAELASQLRDIAFVLPDADFDKLHYACTWHTDGRTSDDPTIGACWDADRLDLWRVEIYPRADLMSTEYARSLVRDGKVGERYLPAGGEEVGC